MIFHTESFFHIAFGDVRTKFLPKNYKHLGTKDVLKHEPFAILKKYMKLENLLFLHQVHSNYGLVLEDKKQLVDLKLFSLEGDFITSTIMHSGIAIATADCLPIILYSAQVPVVSVIHAGWRGSVAQVAVKALEQMQIKFGVNPSLVRVFFGPSAKRCCYSVGPEVDEMLNAFSFKEEVLQRIDDTLFFDLPFFNQLLLEEAGVHRSSFNTTYNACTLCSSSFCSYRTTKTADRQMTVVALK